MTPGLTAAFFDNWADPVVVKGIRYAYAHYDEDDIIRALRAYNGACSEQWPA